MKTLEKGQDKIKKICDKIRFETIEPAKQESESIIKEAEARAEKIVREAELKAVGLIEQARKSIEHERNVFHSSLAQSSVQTIEALRQFIEQKMFNEQLYETLAKQMNDPAVVAKLITSIIQAVEKDGISADLAAIIPKSVSAEEVNRLLAKEALEKLEKHGVTIGNFGGGAQVKLVNKQLTLDITDKALADFLKGYMRKDFRKLIFAEGA